MTDTLTHAPARPVYLTTEDIASRYGVNEDTARRWIRQGRLPAIRIGGAYRVRLDDLLRLERLNERSPDGEPSGAERPRLECHGHHHPAVLARGTDLFFGGAIPSHPRFRGRRAGGATLAMLLTVLTGAKVPAVSG
jgi:excisionase family DNA binding protein